MSTPGALALGARGALHINMLPPEVLQLIFIHAREKFHQRKKGELYAEIEATHVCRHWRLLALDTPRLWNL